MLQCLALGLNYWQMDSLSWRWLYLELVYDLCVGDNTYYMMVYSYIVDITQQHERQVFKFIHYIILSQGYIYF